MQDVENEFLDDYVRPFHSVACEKLLRWLCELRFDSVRESIVPLFHKSLALELVSMSNRRRIQTVSTIRKETEPLEEIPVRSAIEQLIGGPIESCSEYAGSVVGRPVLQPHANETIGEQFARLARGTGLVHPFVHAVHSAYQYHRPLVLSPDMFWLLITQGLAHHINNNPDDLREKFVGFSEKELIEVRRDDFIKGAIENSWEELFAEFSSRIRERIGDWNYSAIVAKFSTTGRVEKAAFEIVLMDCVKNYFEFTLRSLCGIPEVVLEGESVDWVHLRDKTEALGRKFNVRWWTDELVPILDQIADNAAGSENPALWENIYKDVDLGSGTPLISGWIVKFFPYLGGENPKGRNPILLEAERRRKREAKRTSSETSESSWKATYRSDVGSEKSQSRHSRPLAISAEQLPGSLSRVPFVWKYQNHSYKMEFLAGFTGFTQDSESSAIRPRIGWAVREVVN